MWVGKICINNVQAQNLEQGPLLAHVARVKVGCLYLHAASCVHHRCAEGDGPVVVWYGRWLKGGGDQEVTLGHAAEPG